LLIRDFPKIHLSTGKRYDKRSKGSKAQGLKGQEEKKDGERIEGIEPADHRLPEVSQIGEAS
jgi:hypothetical protein